MIIKKKLMIVIAGFAIIGLFSACVSGNVGSANYSLPRQAVLLDYVRDQFKNTVDSRALVLNTNLSNPVEIEVREYKLDSTGKPIVDLIAYVPEIALGQQGSEITSAIVRITMKWIADQGFDLRRDRIIPICTITQRQQGEQTMRVFGRSNYDPDTGSIVWHQAYN